MLGYWSVMQESNPKWVQNFRQDVHPSRGIWPWAVLHKVMVTFWSMQLRMQWTVRCTAIEASGGQEQHYVRSAWHLQSCIRLAWHFEHADVPPGRAIWWPRVVLPKVILTLWRMQLRMQWTVRCTPSRGIWWSRAVLHKVSLTFTVMHQVSLTFWACRHTPWYSHLVVKSSTT